MFNLKKLNQTKNNVLVLSLAQSFLGCQLPMIFVLGSLSGEYLSTNKCLSTLPISLVIIGSMTTSPFLSKFMSIYGRKKGFIIGTFAGFLGSFFCAFGLIFHNFYIFLLGSFFSGCYMCSYSFYRFAVADTAEENFRVKAISYVMAAGLISAILGTQLVKITNDFFMIPFLGAYVTILFINFIGVFIFFKLDIPIKKKDVIINDKKSNIFSILNNKLILYSIFFATLSYLIMNLVMTATPLAIIGCGLSKNNAADVVMAHVLAMSLPSFFTGRLIIKYGEKKIIMFGIFLLLFSAIGGILGDNLSNFYFTLILLGIGWNFSFVSATSMLTNKSNKKIKEKIQGINDFIVFGFVAAGSMLSGSILSCFSANINEGWFLLNLIVFFSTTIIIILLLFKINFTNIFKAN